MQWAVVVGASLAGAVSDAKSRRISNRLTVPLLLSGLLWAGWLAGPAGLADAGAGCAVLALPCTLLFVFGGGGAGDAKLMGAVGAWLGVINSAIALVAISLCGISLALVYTLASKRVRPVLANIAVMTYQAAVTAMTRGKARAASPRPRQTMRMQTMPYGLAIFAGVCLAAGGALLWRA